ncbi:MAG: response regulator transcription factor [Anaerolineae bacterium]|nr:response regulator transcription factor [Anaerolineae bacterium]
MNKGKTIVVIDDEATIRDVVRRYLEVEGFRVIEVEDGHQALDLLRDQRVDLILLDIMLPGVDGFSLARLLRNAPDYQSLHGEVPIIMLTARGDERDRLGGFELGIDDYIVKPFSPREVVARVKAVLRRSAPDDAGSEEPRTFGDLHIDPRRRVVILRGEPVSLTAKEFDLLWLFARHPQQVLTRDQLLDHVWGHDFYGDESTVTVHIRRLREKIEPDPANPIFIHTLRGVGYKFEPA